MVVTVAGEVLKMYVCEYLRGERVGEGVWWCPGSGDRLVWRGSCGEAGRTKV